ncbi:MAG TPA: transmembrane sensor domain protein [Cyanobacteria bacterium UBA8543]|nr:transmembrane sensor domain protein [Cyanobacteria bacterium UBA8543]
MLNKIVTNVTRIRSLFSNGNGRTTAAFAFGRSVVLTSVVVTGVLVGLRQIGTMEGLELGAYDQLVRSHPDQGPDNRLLVVGVTETDIQTRQEYPIKDDTLAQLLEKLQQYQPRTIGVDILRDVPQGSPQGRIALENILKQNDSIIAGCKLSSADQPGIAAAPGVTEERVGFADLPLDPGGTLRRSLLLSIPTTPKTPPPIQHICNIPDPNNQLPSFSFQLALLYLEAQNIQPEQTKTGEIKLGSTVFKRLGGQSGGYHQADVADYRLMLRYRSPKNAVKQVSLTEVLDGKVDPALVKDRIVLIGYTAPIVKDDFYTPYSAGLQDNQKMPGVVIQAQNVSQILSAVLDNRPLIWYWPEGSEILWIWGWSLVGAILGWRIRRLWLFGLGVVAAVGVLYGTCYVIFSSSGWVPLVPPALALAIAAGTVVLVDRGYAKAIYQGVKKVILNIEIDEEKKQQQIAEITETESFAELEKKAEELRNRRRRDKLSENVVESETEVEEATQVPQEAEPTEEDDYFQQLQKRGKQLRNTQRETTPTPQDSQSIEESQEEDYFEQLQKRGKKLRNTEDESNT